MKDGDIDVRDIFSKETLRDFRNDPIAGNEIVYFDTIRKKYIPSNLKDEYDSIVKSEEGEGSKIFTDLVRVNYKESVEGQEPDE